VRLAVSRLALTATIGGIAAGGSAASTQAYSETPAITEPARATSPANGALVGAPAPDFSRRDVSGKPQRLGAYIGKTILLNFWATWCTPCVAELPRFSDWQRRYGGAGLQVLGVSMDDDPRELERFLHRSPVAYPVVRGDIALAERFGGVFGLPLSFLIAADGRIVDRIEGEVDLAVLERQIRQQLRASPEGVAR
jgi:cytochrome c biogenesis protein CcmG/thiol:disulfide interchange protein DsbE